MLEALPALDRDVILGERRELDGDELGERGGVACSAPHREAEPVVVVLPHAEVGVDRRDGP